MDHRILPMGDSALLVELDDLDAVLAVEAELRSHVVVGGSVWALVEDIVPAARTVLVTLRPDGVPALLAHELRAVLSTLDPKRPPNPGARAAQAGDVTIEVTYDGADLADVAALTGLTEAEVVAAHTGTAWRVAFGGFAPGFAYLVGGDPRLQVPRRATPRTSVPAGSVALAGEFSAIYPRSSPGGWQLIGTTNAVLWDTERDPPALLTPGSTVRFVATPLAAHGPDPSATPHPDEALQSDRAPTVLTHSPSRSSAASPALEILATGPLALLQDRGRPGHADVGVSRSGAADRTAYALGHRLLGNPPGTPSIEVLLGGLVARAHGHLLVALTGAPVAATVDGRPVADSALVAVADGATLRLGMPSAGLRTYLAVRGGFVLEQVLGSAATDTLSGLGPAPLAPGDLLPVGNAAAPEVPHLDHAPVRPPARMDDVVDIVLTRGPRHDWFAATETLTSGEWVVSPDSNRTAVRLQPLKGASSPKRVPSRQGTELPSEGLVRGALQVPPSRELVLFLNDHPVTGGYPVIAVAGSRDVDRAAQLVPGQRVRWRWATSGTR